MAYEPFVWKDGPEGETPITAARLNAIEQALQAVSLLADDLEERVEELEDPE